ncbi:MAG: hypothetical protein ACD_29C00094G0002 [uncultured bacterium]|nr:MAG: hypothetical protein ACD_29C00094G0002 [uncultured bacterium]OGT46921.1 MAG: 2-amino-4-hydroxy-6-hydroxymethyldihydropteridine diphosphokinase [Gammaproteobacteria bacterium RIFCSPHIGHO2_12_FULL_38_11]
MHVIAYIGLGSNLNHPMKQIQIALEHIKQLPKTRLLNLSSLYETKPIGPQNQPDFINQVVAIKTTLTALALLKALKSIENTMGRIHLEKWGPRIIDCDILLYGDAVINSDMLTVPHAGLTKRAFVLYLLKEIAPDLVLPSGQTVQSLLQRCPKVGLKQVECIV